MSSKLPPHQFPIIIRTCKPSDLKAIEEIENSSFDDPYPLPTFLELLSNSQNLFRVAVLDCRVTGYCIVASDREKFVIVSIAVHPLFRRKKIGSLLVEDAISQCKEQTQREALIEEQQQNEKERRMRRNIKRLRKGSIALQVRKNNAGAISLYSKFGFLAETTIPNYYGSGRDALFMRLIL